MKISNEIKLGLGALAVLSGVACVHDLFFMQAAPVRFTVAVGETASAGYQAHFLMNDRARQTTLLTRDCSDIRAHATPDLSTAFAAVHMPEKNREGLMRKFQKDLPVLWKVARIECPAMAV